MDELNNTFKHFVVKIEELKLYANFISTKTTKYYGEYLKNQKELLDKSKFNYDIVHSTRPVYNDIQNNDDYNRIISDIKLEHNIDDLLTHNEYYQNKQLQWLFVESYELFEKFITEIYVLIGYCDNNFWDATDFGKIQI